MNEFELIAAMLWELNRERERLSGFEHHAFRDYYNRLSTLLERVKRVRETITRDYEPVPVQQAMTIQEACEWAQLKVGQLAPLIRCWTNKTAYKCAIGLGGAGRAHVIMGGGDNWEQAINAMDTYIAGPKVHCNICNRPDCDTPNQKH